MKQLFTLALLVVACARCGGGNNTKQYVITSSNQTVVAGSNATCPEVDAQITQTAFRADLVVTVFQGDKDHWYLDVGGKGLEGTLKEGTYTFTGSDSKTSYVPSANDKQLQVQESNTTTVTLKVDGNSVSGTSVGESKAVCQSLGGLITCQNADVPSANGGAIDCIRTSQLNGVQVADPEFKQVTAIPAK